MAEAKRLVKVGVLKGAGPLPGYEWTVLILGLAMDDADKKLNEHQYAHLEMQVKDLATHRDPTRSDTLSLDRVESFFELRDKGGGLGPGVNARVFYYFKGEDKTLRILGIDVKKKEGKISEVVKDRILRRQSNWESGLYPTPELVMKRTTESPAGREKR